MEDTAINGKAVDFFGSMDMDALVRWVNDNMADPYALMFPDINRMDDENVWDAIGTHLGGYLLARSLNDSRRTMDMRCGYFVFDEDTRKFTSFRYKSDLVDYIGLDNLVQCYLDSAE